MHALLKERDKLTPIAKSTIALEEEVKRLKEDNEMQELLLDKLLGLPPVSKCELEQCSIDKSFDLPEITCSCCSR